MTISIDGTGLTIDKLMKIARQGEKVELHPDAVERIKTCRTMVEEKIQAHEIMYGVNTGIGEFSERVLNDEQVQLFQKYLIYNHAAGIGEPCPIEQIRGAMAGRINVHAHGNSGCRPEITLTMVEMLNKGVTPVVCQKGSVGASGDLAPMSQIALLLMGEGEAYYQGERLPGHVAMERAGIAVPGLQARDGLAAINGSNLLTAMSALHLYDMNRWLKQAEIACAMSLEALLANLKPYDLRLHQVRGYKGAIRAARAIMKCIEGSDLTTGKMKTKVQDAYSMRSSPQVIGAAHAALLERGWRQPHIPSRIPFNPDRGQFPGNPGEPANGYGRGRHHHGVCTLRTEAEPANQSGAQCRIARFPDQGGGDVFGDDAESVYCRQPDR